MSGDPDDWLKVLQRRIEQQGGKQGFAKSLAKIEQLLDRSRADSELRPYYEQRARRRAEELRKHLDAAEEGTLQRFARHATEKAAMEKKRLGQKLLHSSLHPAYLKLFPPKPAHNEYADWLHMEKAAAPSTEQHRKESERWRFRPCVSILLPVHNPRKEWLQEAIDSVTGQSYSNWQLCICDDASQEAWVYDYLHERAEAELRIRLFCSPHALGISGALNHAAVLSTGEYAGFLDHDDVLSPAALHYVVEALQDEAADVIYTDEDWIDEQGKPLKPHFKPGWSPDLLACCMYVGHLVLVKRSRLDRIGWFRGEYDGAQDYDLALRATEGAKVRHVAKVLYHWRAHPESTAQSVAIKPYTHVAGRLALEDAVKRRGWPARVEDGRLPNWYLVRHQPPRRPLVSIVAAISPQKSAESFSKMLSMRTAYPNRELLAIRTVEEREARTRTAEGEVLLFLSDCVEPLHPDWLDYLVEQAQRPEIGAAGAKLVTADGSIEHAGIATGMMDGTGNPGRGLFRSDTWIWLNLTRDVNAVDVACLATRRDVFLQCGGFDPRFPW
ncbi:MAG: glycosyltransferase family 2 protein, partial [Bryobacteraceae bacterium]